MSNEKIILYGMGAHAKSMLSRYHISVNQIEAVIDNSPKEVRKLFEGSGVKVYSWDEFVCQGSMSNCQIVISSSRYRNEIEMEILKSGLFQPNQVVYIDEWCAKVEGEEFGNWLIREDYKRVARVPKIKEEALRNAAVLFDRVEALKRMPKDLIVAEVGVAFGDLSEKIFEIMQPSKFYGIDLFSENVTGFWNDNRFERAGMTHLQWYESRFCNAIRTGRFEAKQGMSWDVLAGFPDAYFDYVYLDADHSYNAVLKDVTILKRKVKDGGIIQFNDYIRYDYNAKVFYGVVPVVNQLIEETNSEVVYYCMSENGFDDIVIRYWR